MVFPNVVWLMDNVNLGMNHANHKMVIHQSSGNNAESTCIDCVAGTSNPTAGATPCTACEAGRWSDSAVAKQANANFWEADVCVLL